MIALMIKRKRPRVTMVIGRVRMTSMGFTKKFRTLSTMATMIAVIMESTPTPGRTYESMITASAFNKSLRINFIGL
jgi:hypothetical protein